MGFRDLYYWVTCTSADDITVLLCRIKSISITIAKLNFVTRTNLVDLLYNSARLQATI